MYETLAIVHDQISTIASPLLPTDGIHVLEGFRSEEGFYPQTKDHYNALPPASTAAQMV